MQEDSGDLSEWLARGELDLDWNYAATHIASIEAGVPVTVLAGMHSGCLELIANDRVHSIAELRGKKVGVYDFSSSPHVLVTLMAAYIGLDPARDIEWVASGDASSLQLFVDGKIDAFLGVPPEPQELRARHIGHTILATAVDEPWSQYYCCMLAGRAEYVEPIPGRHQACACGPCSRRSTFACRRRRRSRGERSVAGSPSATTTRSRRLSEAPLSTAGASSTPRTRCGSTRSGSTRSA